MRNRFLISLIAIIILLVAVVYAIDVPITVAPSSIQNNTWYNATTNATMFLNISTVSEANVTYILNGGAAVQFSNNVTINWTNVTSVEGVNVIVINATNATNVSETNLSTITYYVDTLVPSANISVNDTAIEFNDESVTIDWNATDTNSQYITANVTYPDGTLLQNLSTDTNDFLLIPTNLTQVGTYTVSTFIVDNGGNTNLTTSTFLVNDTVFPAATIAVNDTAIEFNDGSVRIDWNVSDANIMTNYANVTAPDGTLIAYSVNNATDFVIGPVNLSQVGIYTVTAWVNDSANNINITNATFLVNDTVFPAATIAVNGTAFELGVESVRIDWNVSDANIMTNYANVTAPDGSLVANSVNNATDFVIGPVNLSQVGTYTVTAWVNDSANNINITNATFLVNDTVIPDVNITINDTTLELGSEKVNISWDTADLNLHINYTNVTYPNGTLLAEFYDPGHVIVLDSNNLTAIGTYIVTAKANDTAGNQNLTTTTFVVSDTVSPTSVTLVLPGDQTLNSNGTIVFRCNATDYQLANISLYHNISGTWTLNQTNVVTGNASSTAFTVDDVTGGAYVWNCLARDTAKNGAWAAANYSVNVSSTIGLILSKTLVTTGKIYKDDTVVFTINITNNGTAAMSTMAVMDTFNSSVLTYSSAGVTPSATGAGSINWTDVGSLSAGSTLLFNVSFTAAANSSSTTNTINVTDATSNEGVSVTRLDTATASIYVGLPNITGFDTTLSTDFTAEADLTSVSNAVISDGNVSITWTNAIDANGADFDNDVVMGVNFVSFNSSSFDSSLNSTATITIYNVSCPVTNIVYATGNYTTLDQLRANGRDCESAGICTNKQCTGTTLTFTVSHFTGYAAAGNANLTVWDEFEGSTTTTGIDIDFYANYTNATNASLISGATCKVFFDDGTNGTMVYNGTHHGYNYTKAYGFNTTGTHNWNVTCNKTGVFTQLTATDTVSLPAPATTTTTTGSSSSSRGGGKGFFNLDTQLEDGPSTLTMRKGIDFVRLDVGEDEYTFSVVEIMEGVEIEFAANGAAGSKRFTVEEDGSSEVDVDGDGYADVRVSVTDVLKSSAVVTFVKLDKPEVEAEELEPEVEPEKEVMTAEEKAAEEQKIAEEKAAQEASKKKSGAFQIFAFVVLIAIVAFAVYMVSKGKKKRRSKKAHMVF